MIVRFRMSPSLLFVLPAFLLGIALDHRSSAVEPPRQIRRRREIHYSPAEDLARIDVTLNGEVTKQVDMAAYVLTDRAIVDALREAAARGVKVRIWRDASMAEKVGDVDVEAQLGERVRDLEIRSNAPGGELMHMKGYCVDHGLLRTGSAKFQPIGRDAPGQRSRGLRGASVCAGFEAKFDRAWGQELDRRPYISHHEFHQDGAPPDATWQ